MPRKSTNRAKPVLLPTIIAVSVAGALTSLWGQEPADTNYDEGKVPRYTLPPLLPEEAAAFTNEERANLWISGRRAEVQSLLEQSVYGRTPNSAIDRVRVRSELVDSSDDALGGSATRRQVILTVSPSSDAEGLNPERSLQIEVLIYAPKKIASASAPAPAFIGLNFYGNQTVHPDPAIRISKGWMRPNSSIGIEENRATEKTRGIYRGRWQAEKLIKRGYALVTAYCGDIDPDNYRHDFTDGVHPLFYKEGQTQPAADEWGAVGAWAWGLSTIRRWLETQAAQNDGHATIEIDAKRMAVIGHSRLGKTALWAGAQDQDFAMVISNDSGCGGAAFYRRCFGERIHHMLKPVGYWFCRNHALYAKRESELPVDQHMLMALVAPRPLYVGSAEEDRWADPKGEFLSAKYATPVYGMARRRGAVSRRYARS
ncbi:MAG: acetylxylan esterase [Verrucomicrobiales bacterium]